MEDKVRKALDMNCGPLDKTIIDIVTEVVCARAKFKSPSGLMTALTEEVGELAKAMLDESWDDVVAEARQVAAMSIRIAEECDPTLHIVRINRGCKDCGCGQVQNLVIDEVGDE